MKFGEWIDELSGKSRKRRKGDARALQDFIGLVYEGEGISPKDSENNLVGGMVKIRITMGNSNGLLVTDNGYFLTAYHCLKDAVKPEIEDADGNVYPIERICAKSETYDAALAKARIAKHPVAKRYKLHNSLEMKRMIRSPVCLMAYRKGKIERVYGFVSSDRFNGIYDDGTKVAENHFTLEYNFAEAGHSGGIIITPDGRLLGLISGSLRGISNGIKIVSLLELVHRYKTFLETQ